MQGGNRAVVQVGGGGPDAVERRGLVADALGVDGVILAEPGRVVVLDGRSETPSDGAGSVPITSSGTICWDTTGSGP